MFALRIMRKSGVNRKDRKRWGGCAKSKNGNDTVLPPPPNKGSFLEMRSQTGDSLRFSSGLFPQSFPTSLHEQAKQCLKPAVIVSVIVSMKINR